MNCGAPPFLIALPGQGRYLLVEQFFFPQNVFFSLISFFFFLNNFIYLFSAVLGLDCCPGFSLVAENRGYSSCFVRPLSGFSCCGTQALGKRASVPVAHGLSSCSCGL